MQKYNFQYCQKIIVFSRDESSVLLCKRKGEADYDGTFSFIGGKMETTDQSIIAGLKREKDEEVGPNFKIKVFPCFTTNILFTKKDGSAMILPHIYAIHLEGDIQLSEEYSEFKWVRLDEIDKFEPKINTIADVISKLAILKKILSETKFEII
jgi:ADP-ribose pyrophosphatase YjhB (NUDIX family)